MYYVWKLLTNILAWLLSPYKFKMFNLAFCSTICWSETRLQDLFHFMGSCSTFSGRCSTNCGTVPQKVELFHFMWVFLDTAAKSIWILSQQLHWNICEQIFIHSFNILNFLSFIWNFLQSTKWSTTESVGWALKTLRRIMWIAIFTYSRHYLMEM